MQEVLIYKEKSSAQRNLFISSSRFNNAIIVIRTRGVSRSSSFFNVVRSITKKVDFCSESIIKKHGRNNLEETFLKLARSKDEI